ncbi:MAG: hypothetical protein MMC23_005323 [Stictis urceolatum]|nr:hypothetical protein [Stictis urceolata]
MLQESKRFYPNSATISRSRARLVRSLFHSASLWPGRELVCRRIKGAFTTSAYPHRIEQRGGSRTRSSPKSSIYSSFDLPRLIERQPSTTRDSTLTQNERSIFERIYKDILDELPDDAVQQDISDDLEPQGEEKSFGENESLETIFQSSKAKIIPQMPRARDTDRRTSTPLTPQAVSAVPSEKRGQYAVGTKEIASTSLEKVSELPDVMHQTRKQETGIAKLKDQAELVEKARVRDAEAFEERLKSARNDTNIWNVLQDHVLQKMEALAAAINKKSEEITDHPEQVSGRTSHQGLKGPKVRAAQHGHVQSMRPWLQTPEVAMLLSVLRSNYASQCFACLNALRTQFPRSQFALAVLPVIKSFGPMSYVLGASTELYNELLFIRWMYYRDMHGCADLMNEMLDRSIAIDVRTLTVFKDAERRRDQAQRIRESSAYPVSNGTGSKKASQPGMTSAAAAWWFLRGNENGWERWQAIQEQASQELHNEQQRKAAAADALSEEHENEEEAEEMPEKW